MPTSNHLINTYLSLHCAMTPNPNLTEAFQQPVKEPSPLNHTRSEQPVLDSTNMSCLEVYKYKHCIACIYHRHANPTKQHTHTYKQMHTYHTCRQRRRLHTTVEGGFCRHASTVPVTSSLHALPGQRQGIKVPRMGGMLKLY